MRSDLSHPVRDRVNASFFSADGYTSTDLWNPVSDWVNVSLFSADGYTSAATASYSTSTYPYDCVCYITDSIGGLNFTASGVIIGPHTVLTASHVLWDADLGQGATNITVYPGYSFGGQSIPGQWVSHYFQINDHGGLITQSTSQQDFAIIDFAADLSAYGSFGIKTDYAGGTVHLTGYPAMAGGGQTDQIGTVYVDPLYSVLDYGSITSHPGNSGGPVWIDLGTATNPLPYVVGVASTTGWAAQLTAADWTIIHNWELSDSYLWTTTLISASTIQNDYLAITRQPLSAAQATTIANSINAGTQTETQYVNSLLSQVANTTIPAVAVEATMYGATGTSLEITSLTLNFLPAQIANATSHGLNPQVYACEALGLVFAFGNETSSTAFANNFGPSNNAMPNTVAGDAAYAAAASSAIFGGASTANLVSVMKQFVANWEAFYTAHGVPGFGNATAAQIDLAARGAAWGDMVGVALANNLGPLSGQVVNFLDDAAQGTAIYGASLVGQPLHQPFG